MSLERLISNQVDSQIKKWNTMNPNGNNNGKRTSKEADRGPVVTISRQPGCGSEALANLLAKDHGLDLFGIGIVDMIAKKANLSRQVVETLDEKSQSALENWLSENMLGGKLSTLEYVKNLRSVVFTISSHGNALIIGRGGAFILPPEKRIALRFVAPLEARVKHIMKKFRLSDRDARTFIEEKTLERRKFTKKHFKADWEDPTSYDITFNTAEIKPKVISEIVGTLLKETGR